MRYYPDFVPSFAHEPTAENFAIRPIDGNVGEGVVALTDFAPGQLVFAFTGFFVSEITLFTLQVRPGLYLHDPYFMGKVLHRCDPNCDVDMEARTFHARKPIRAGDWVTMNYEQTEDQLFRAFRCHCGDTPCHDQAPGRLVVGRAPANAGVEEFDAVYANAEPGAYLHM
ncbi:MAG: SET domain-containing protein-lysine N-methyltransferase [Proteobacteria bacterium]|nr:SET domain-containing protein-lysine N-methyltransferase [Pseudomonadota bacterium]